MGCIMGIHWGLRYAERRMRGSAPARWGPPSGLACAVLAVLAAGSLAGCSGNSAALGPPPVESCSQQRLNVAYQLYTRARSDLVKYYQERAATSLDGAYYFAGDAMLAARLTRTCPDFDSAWYARALDVWRSALQLRQVANSTMRDPDAAALEWLLGDRYSEVFRKDIE